MKTSNIKLFAVTAFLVTIVVINTGCPHSVSKSPRTIPNDSTAGNPPALHDSTAGNPPKKN